MMGQANVPSSSRLWLSVICLAAFGLSAGAARGATCSVTSTDDGSSAATTAGTLRYCLSNLTTGTAGGTNGITITATGTITLSSTLPTINDGVMITGPGANKLTIDGGGSFQILSIGVSAAPTVSISGLTFANGKTSGTGGAISINTGTLTVTNSVFSGNSAASGGAIANSGGLVTVTGSMFSQNSATGAGGAIYSTNTLDAVTLTATNNTFSGNISGGNGGAIDSSSNTSLTNNTFYINSAGASGSGGAFYLGGAFGLTANNNLFVGNLTGGAIVNGGTGSVTAGNNVYYGNGGNNCTGGGCPGTQPSDASSNPLTLPLGYYGGTTQTYLPQPGSKAICAGLAADVPAGVTTDERGFLINPGYNPCAAGSVDAGAVQTNYIKVQSSGDSGAGAADCQGSSCTLRDAVLLANSNGYGDIDFAAGVTSITLASANGTLGLTGTTGIDIVGPGANALTVNGGGSSSNFSVFTVDAGVPAVLYGLTISNGTGTNGGGIYNAGSLTLASSAVTNSAAADGGGIDNAGSALLLLDSTISGNTSSIAGGGISNGGGSLRIVESTISGNSVTSTGGGDVEGGGIGSNGSFTAINSTVAGNSASGLGQGIGGGIYIPSGTASLANTIVSGNTGSGGGNADVAGAYSGTGNVIGGSVALGALGLYGPNATVQTQIPLPGGTNGNPAICGGLAANLPAGITTDERGEPNSNTTYTGYSSSSPCVDAGAVQTNYTSVQFVTQPANGTVSANISPAPTVEVLETDSATSATDAVSGVPVTLTLTGSGTLSGATQTTGGTPALATFSGLQVDTAGMGDALSASLTVVSGVTLTATSSQFNVVGGVSQIAVSAPSTVQPSTPFSITVTAEDTAGNVNTGYTGTVQFTTSDSATGVLVPSNYKFQPSDNGTHTFTNGATLVTMGSQTITATDSKTSSITGTANITVAKATPTITLTGSPNPVQSAGTTVTFTATVTGPNGGPTPTGTITFTENGTNITPGQGNSCGNNSPHYNNGIVNLVNGSAVCTTSTLPGGNLTIVANYSGDSSYSSSQDDSLTEAVGQAQSSTSVTSSTGTSASTVNESVTFTVTVGPANANLTGTVTVTDTTTKTTLCSIPANSSSSQTYTCSTQSLAKGQNAIQAAYSGDQTYSSSNQSLTQQVDAGVATIPSFSSSSNPSIVNSTVTFTATVSVPSGPTPPAGSVSFTANGKTITGCSNITLTLSSANATSGTASCPTSSLVASTTPYTIVATYTDTNNNFTTVSATLNPAQTVSAAATTVLITAAPSTTTVNVPVTYTVTATAASTTYPLSGTVQVSDNGSVICSGLTLTQAAGSPAGTNQSCTESNLTAGVHTITATYNLSGSDANNGTGSGSTTVPVAPAITSITVISSQNPSVVANPNNVNDSVTFTAAVTSTGTISVPLRGSVTFTENGLVLEGPGCPSPAPVNAAGQASCTTTSLPAGADTILAVYSNDTNYTGSSGYLSANNQVVPQTVQDYSLVISSTPPVVVSQGYTSSSDLFTPQTISVVPISIQGFATATTPAAAPLNLACSVAAVFSPASTPTLPLCTPAKATLAVSGTGAQGAVPIVVDATKASAGIYTVTETGTDPTTGLVHSASFQVTVESASDPVTVVSGATTGNGGNLSFMLPAGVTLSNILCKSVSGPNLTGSVSPDSLGITCSFNPTSITNNSATIEAVQLTVTVGTSGTTGSASAANARHTNLWVAGLLGLPFFGLMGLIGGRKSSRSVFFRLMVIAVVCMVAFQALGCGGSFKTLPANSSGGGGKTPPGVYKVLVVGTGSDGQTYEAVLQLNVQL